MNNQNFDSQFADQVARVCYEKFEKLPKSGKPVENEWTYLAAIIKHDNGKLEVISIATGSKCIGKRKLSPCGDIINDSHAEVLARRGFLKYLYDQIKCAKLKGKSHILTSLDGGRKYSIIRPVTFHFFSSHMPCGDAAIFPKCSIQEINLDKAANELMTAVTSEEITDYNKAAKRRRMDAEMFLNSDIGDVVDDIHRTGAKCLPHERNPDPKQAGSCYHVVGCVRTKPGRGDPTMSVSCSDKILRWNCVGIQGALLSLLLPEPIYLSSIIIGNHDSLYFREALNRAVINRNSAVAEINRCPVLLHSNLEFKFCKRLCGIPGKPSPCGILWCNVPKMNHEVLVEGRRLGWTKKTSSRAQPLSITKRMFLQTFKSVTENAYNDYTYYEIKQKAASYQNAWKNFKTFLGLWTEKSNDLVQFK